MTTSMVVEGHNEIARTSVDLSDRDLDIIKRTVFTDATDAELMFFANVCNRMGLDPFAKQIYAWKDKGKITIQVAIDGYRVIAERSGKYEGQTPTEWCGEDGVWTQVWLKKSPPVAARVGIFRRGFREPMYGIAHYSGYVKPNLPTWTMNGVHMIAKVAEALGLRKSFPNELGGTYIPEEIERPTDSPQRPEGNSVQERLQARANTDSGNSSELSPIIESIKQLRREAKLTKQVDFAAFLADRDLPVAPSTFDQFTCVLEGLREHLDATRAREDLAPEETPVVEVAKTAEVDPSMQVCEHPGCGEVLSAFQAERSLAKCNAFVCKEHEGQ